MDADSTRRRLVRTAAPRSVGEPRLTLAWKLLWLHMDGADGDGPAAKDLYDAVILAESRVPRLSAKLLRTVLGPRRELTVSAPDPASWSTFLADHPGIGGTAQDWADRLRAALAGPEL